MPAVFIANKGRQYEKVLSNIHEVRARGGHVIVIATEGDEFIKTAANDVLYIPDIPEPLSPLLTVIPLQLMAYHAAAAAGTTWTSRGTGRERDGGVSGTLIASS